LSRSSVFRISANRAQQIRQMTRTLLVVSAAYLFFATPAIVIESIFFFYKM
jgi:hypothetical protein